MANGLLSGLVEYWQPDESLHYLGLVNSLTALGGSPDRTRFVDQPLFPGRVAFQATSGGIAFQTDPSVLLENMGNIDFLMYYWYLVLPSVGETYTAAWCGLNNQSGFYIETGGIVSPDPDEIDGAIPGHDRAYSCSISSGSERPSTNNVVHLIAIWYTNLDNTLHISLDGNAPYTSVETGGIGDPDPTNYIGIESSQDSDGVIFQGPGALWQGAEAVDNVASKLREIYTQTLGYYDFDNNGSGAHPLFLAEDVEIGFGPFHSIISNERPFATRAVSGVVVDVYIPQDGVPDLGQGTFSASTESSGRTSIIFTQGLSTREWVTRTTYPIGTWDPSRPDYMHQLINKFPPRRE